MRNVRSHKMKIKAFIFAAIFSLLSLSAHSSDRYAGLTYPDKDSSEYLKLVLKSLDIKYTETTKPNGQHIEWASDSETLEEEIRNRVGQYHFIKTVCKNLPIPPPSQPAKKELSC